jgi:hypothetical protein
MSISDIRESVPPGEKAAWIAAGFVAVTALHVAGGWWLNSGSGVLRTVLVLAAVGVIAGSRRYARPWARAWLVWAGAISGTAVLLIWIGPGNLWPIVLAIAAALSAVGVFGGALLASLFRRRGDQPPERARKAR